MISEEALRQLAEDIAAMRSDIAKLKRIEQRVDSNSVTDATAAATANTIAKRDSVSASAFNAILFAASQVSHAGANAFDDYEEGTWTPSLDAETGQVGSFTYTNQVGQYTKIGRFLHCSFYLSWSAKPSAGNVVRIGGLPYSAATASMTNGYVSYVSGVTFTERGGGTTGTMLTIANYNTTYCVLSVMGSGMASADNRINMAQLGTSGVLLGAVITYTAT